LIVFTVIVCFVFMNLFIGIILEGFDTADETKRSIKPEDFEAFSDHWTNFDPTGTFYISMAVLQEFVQTLYEPWGFGDYVATKTEVKAKIAELDLKVTKDGKVHFKDVLMGLSKEAIKTEFLMAKMREYDIAMDVIHRAKAPLFNKLVKLSVLDPKVNFTVGHHFAAEVIQEFYKDFVKGNKKPANWGDFREARMTRDFEENQKRAMQDALDESEVDENAAEELRDVEMVGREEEEENMLPGAV